MSLFRRCVIHPLGENWWSSSIILTLFDSICKTESSYFVDNLSWLILIAKSKIRPDGALDRNTAQLSIGTAMLSWSEYRETGRAFSYPFNATSKYSQTVTVHHIMHGIFNNIVTRTKTPQVTALSCRFWRKCNFACKRPKSKIKMLIVRCTRNQMSRNVHHRTRVSLSVPTMMIC